MSVQSQYNESHRRPSTVTKRAPRVGTLIDFSTPGAYVVRGAMVTAKEYFCGEWNVFVEYTITGYDGRLYGTSGWVALSEVR